jgi:hypothetical protein
MFGQLQASSAYIQDSIANTPDSDTPLPVGPNFISWTYNSGEPSLVNLQLLHKNNDTFQPIKDLLSSQGIFAPAININESMMLFTPAW